MKKSLSIILLLFSPIVLSQNIYEYEKKISKAGSYDFDEIEFQNQIETIKLSGTLIKPKTAFDKIVIIVPGSGKDTRNSHYILAEKLLENNIAVYRFDERGIGKSGGEYSESANDLSNDLNLAFKKLRKSYNDKKIGIIGHSIGGIATLKVVEKGVYPDFIVLIETPVLKNGAFVINQFKMNYENSLPEIMREGKTKNEMITFMAGFFNILRTTEANLLKKEARKFIKDNGFDKKFIVLLNDEFLVEMATTNLEETIRHIPVQSLYLTGTKDRIINHKDETSLVKSFENPNIQIKVFDGLNHYLTDRKGVIGSSLYNMDQEALNFLISWILKNNCC